MTLRRALRPQRAIIRYSIGTVVSWSAPTPEAEHMSEDKVNLSGPDLGEGVALSSLADGAMLLGHAQGEPVILARCGQELFAVGATCSHYGGPLAEGLMVDDTVRCPWHHACFSLRTGEALRAPALNPLPCWRVEQRDGIVHVRDKLEPVQRPPIVGPNPPGAIVIVGGGAAGNAAAETLRAEGYGGSITMLSADDSLPCDRPNLSKAYLAGSAPEEWIPLRSREFYAQQRIDVRLGVRVAGIDPARREVALEGGSRERYDALLLATGAAPVRLEVPGADRPHVHYLRTLADSRSLIAGAATARRVVVIGASFIGLEVAASLRARNVEVAIVGRETCPMAQVLGVEVGALIRKLHEEHGVTFHLGTTVASIEPRHVVLASGEQVPADLVVVGIGVRPSIALAEAAGLAVDRGILVNEYLETSVPGVFAAGDIARWPDAASGERIRIEHWVVAERQGQTAARNMLGRRERFDAVPFFWTEQYDFTLSYVGHADRFDQVQIDGALDQRDCAIIYRRSGEQLAAAVIHRDLAGLRAEVEFERRIAASQRPIVARP
jgi:NADPH-dependent 2,4-dienoyl-CoA reductase/sulfur reductase-like enzyme/nitrite reductase/ring-hydroxylating ferredoxin subunit